MKVITRYFYENGEEMNQHDIVHLEGKDTDCGLTFEGLCRIASIEDEFLTLYPLGHSIDTNHMVCMYIPKITKLVKIEGGDEIDKVITQAVKRSLKKDRE